MLHLSPPNITGQAGTFSANRIQLNVNTSSVVVDQGSIPEALIFVRFPKGDLIYNNTLLLPLRLDYPTMPSLTLSVIVPEEAAVERATPSNVSLGFVLYQNDRFFRSRRYIRQRATIRVLSGTVQGPLVPQHLEMMFRPQVRMMFEAIFFPFLVRMFHFQPRPLNLNLIFIKWLSSWFLHQDLQCKLKRGKKKAITRAHMPTATHAPSLLQLSTPWPIYCWSESSTCLWPLACQNKTKSGQVDTHTWLNLPRSAVSDD